MVKNRSGMLVGVVWSCADVKFLLTTLILLCSLATVVHFLPSTNFFFPNSPLDFTSCLTSKISPNFQSPNLSSTPPLALAHPMKHDRIDGDVVQRAFNPVGSGGYLFIQMGAYRGGAATFAVVGLASKPIHVFAKPKFHCEWTPHDDGNGTVSVEGYKILPDWGYGRVYTVVVVNCTFPSPVGGSGSGGRLVIRATTGGGGDRDNVAEERFVALEEAPSSVELGLFDSSPEYDYLYCGSPLYGKLSPQRVREWVAYHARLFGERAHFVIYDAGGVHSEVMEVLRPWIEKGVVTLHDIREQERFDGYYHNQFLVVNDCLHRYRFAAKWMFFFDLDEFIYVEPRTTLASLLDSLSGYTQFTIEQMPMSSKICLSDDASGKTPRMWGMEKLVYRDVKRGERRDRKYAIQPRGVFATGVHMSQNVNGRTLHQTERRIKYFHFHGTIANRREPCRQFSNATGLTVDGTPFVRDDTLRRLASHVKRFEIRAIGSRLQRTRQ